MRHLLHSALVVIAITALPSIAHANRICVDDCFLPDVGGSTPGGTGGTGGTGGSGAVAVPEPAGMALLAVGAVGLVTVARRRRDV